MIKLKVVSNIDEALQLCQELGSAVAPEMARSLNRVAHGVRTDVTRQIAKTREIARDELKNWSFRSATPENLEAQAIILGKRLGMEKFNPSPNQFMGGKTTGGVTVSLFGKSQQFRHAFMGLKTGTPRVLQRDKSFNPKSRNKDPRFRLKNITAPAVPQMADDKDVVEVVESGAEHRYLQQFDNQINRLLEDFK